MLQSYLRGYARVPARSGLKQGGRLQSGPSRVPEVRQARHKLAWLTGSVPAMRILSERLQGLGPLRRGQSDCGERPDREPEQLKGARESMGATDA